MDIDIIEEAQAAGASSQSVRKPIIALVDDAHPFDLEGYISNYTGNFALNFWVHSPLHSPV
jgi:COP9 signalosome complex subunit 1